MILDANVLFRILISQGRIFEVIFHAKLEMVAPERLKEEFLKNRDEILQKTMISEEEFDALAELLFSRIQLVPLAEYKEFIPEAKALLGKHEKDEDFVALSLKLNIKIWTYEDLLFKIGRAISTKELSNELNSLPPTDSTGFIKSARDKES